VTRPGPGKGPLAAALALVLAACAAQNLAAADVILLKSNDVLAWRPALDAIRRAASAQTLTEFDLRGLKEEATQVLEGLKAKAGDAIFVAVGPLAASAVREAFPQSRVVFCMVQDPKALGLLGAPGVTGVAFAVPLRNQLAAFRMVNPAAVRIGVVYKPDTPDAFIQEATAAAASVRLALVPKPIASEKDVPNALRSLLSGGEAADALWLVPDAIMLGDDTRRFVMSETLKAGRPVYAFSAALIPEGALVSDGPDIASIGEQVGDLVKRLAAGEKGRIDMLMPRSDLVINKKIAGKLKVEIPGDALRAAARVY
jgi:putative tryptophan/tyrosine transport system substrate-binding protein